MVRSKRLPLGILDRVIGWQRVQIIHIAKLRPGNRRLMVDPVGRQLSKIVIEGAVLLHHNDDVVQVGNSAGAYRDKGCLLYLIIELVGRGGRIGCSLHRMNNRDAVGKSTSLANPRGNAERDRVGCLPGQCYRPARWHRLRVRGEGQGHRPHDGDVYLRRDRLSAHRPISRNREANAGTQGPDLRGPGTSAPAARLGRKRSLCVGG